MRVYFGWGDGERGHDNGGVLIAANNHNEARVLAWREIGDEYIHSGARWIRKGKHLLKFAKSELLTASKAHVMDANEAICRSCNNYIFTEDATCDCDR